MYEILKQLAADNGWEFIYARRDFQNLYNEVEDPNKIYLFLDPVQITNNYGDYNELDSVSYNGSFMLLKSSDLDEGYEERYQQDIKPLIASQMDLIREAIFNSEIAINHLRSTEIINLFDYNFNGLVVNYSLTDSTV